MSKAETIFLLKKKIKKAKILDLIFFSVKDYKNNKEKFIKKINSKFSNINELIVRSSAKDEDLKKKTNAGKYLSITNVKKIMVRESIDKVVDSYGANNSNQNLILIQPMLKNVYKSGVFLSIEPNKKADYFVINYNYGIDTTSVTSGKKCLSRYIFKNKKINCDFYSRKLIELHNELKKFLKFEHFDIEFAFDKNKNLFLLQVRQILTNKIKQINTISSLENIKKKIKQMNFGHSDILGKKTILGIMPDWNPAEIIGVYPKPLAISLYKELITDNVWAYQRDNYGYKKLRSFPLLIDLEGLPYIDVRLSFNSFVPKGISKNISEKLVNYYLKQLEDQPYLHDKVEFDIVFSCYTFSLKNKLNKLKKFDFSSKEIKIISKKLRELTNQIICKNGLWEEDLKKIKKLEERFKNIENTKLGDLDKVYWLVEDCKRYGTLPFAGLARAAFIATQILNSLVDEQLLTEDEKLNFLNSLETINYSMNKDFNNLSKSTFLSKYGHLRPGTYDISSFRYDEKPNLYFDWKKRKKSNYKKRIFKLNSDQIYKIENSINKHGLEKSPIGLLKFIKSTIEAREYAKFAFSKNISEILKLLKNIGRKFNLTEEDLSFINIKDILKNYSSSKNVFDEIKKSIDIGKENFSKTEKILLPPIIKNSNEIYNFSIKDQKPNFVTKEKIIAEVSINFINIKNKIVFLKNADPGYDWIFTRKIAGFITAYGGINSHMSIRAMELKIPAIIGAGEKNFYQWKKSKKLLIDCSNQFVKKL